MGLFESLTSFDNWFLESLDFPNEKIQGQFPTEPTESVSSSYVQHNSLNRESPIVQFLNGNASTVSFEALFYARSEIETPLIEIYINQLKKWVKRDDRLARPQLLKFYVGNGHLEMSPCILTDLANIKYGTPTITGAARQITTTINLTNYTKFEFENIPLADTRYHRVKDRDYYELLSYREYGSPNFGDALRKLHPTKPNIQVSNIVKLPSRETISLEKREPKSLQLQTAYGKADTNQRALRIALFERTNRTLVSHIVKE